MYGAADPSSGTATMIEVAKAFGWLKKKGEYHSKVFYTSLVLQSCKPGFLAISFIFTFKMTDTTLTPNKWKEQ